MTTTMMADWMIGAFYEYFEAKAWLAKVTKGSIMLFTGHRSAIGGQHTHVERYHVSQLNVRAGEGAGNPESGQILSDGCEGAVMTVGGFAVSAASIIPPKRRSGTVRSVGLLKYKVPLLFQQLNSRH